MLSQEQSHAIELMNLGVNVALSGEGGTGKSYAIEQFLEGLSDSELDKTLVMAPTGVAAKHIHGVTLHRGLKLSTTPYGPDKEPPPYLPDVLEVAERIIIDEISMVRFDLFTYIAKCIHRAIYLNKRNIQLIVIGDFYQLPPVLTDKDLDLLYWCWEKMDTGESLEELKKSSFPAYRKTKKKMEETFLGGYAFQSPMWESFQFHHIHFTEQHRQSGDPANSVFVEHLNLLRKALSDEEKQKCVDYFSGLGNVEQEEEIYIVPTNGKAREINKAKLDALIKKGAEQYTYRAVINGNITAADKPPVEDEIELCEGAKVMCIMNDSEKGLVNGDTGIITHLTGKYVDVAFDNGKNCRILPFEWKITDARVKKDIDGKNVIELFEIGNYTQLPLRVAYAITVHKSQGMTFARANLSSGFFANGQFYVGASRVKSAEGLSILGEIRKKDIMTSVAVRRYYDSGGTELSTIRAKYEQTKLDLTDGSLYSPETKGQDPMSEKTGKKRKTQMHEFETENRLLELEAENAVLRETIEQLRSKLTFSGSPA